MCSVIEMQFAALLDQTEKEDLVPQAVRHYLTEMAELTELAKERLDQVKVERMSETFPLPLGVPQQVELRQSKAYQMLLGNLPFSVLRNCP